MEFDSEEKHAIFKYLQADFIDKQRDVKTIVRFQDFTTSFGHSVFFNLCYRSL